MSTKTDAISGGTFRAGTANGPRRPAGLSSTAGRFNLARGVFSGDARIRLRMSAESHLADVWTLELSTLKAADVARCNAVISPADKDRVRRFRFERGPRLVPRRPRARALCALVCDARGAAARMGVRGNVERPA